GVGIFARCHANSDRQCETYHPPLRKVQIDGRGLSHDATVEVQRISGNGTAGRTGPSTLHLCPPWPPAPPLEGIVQHALPCGHPQRHPTTEADRSVPGYYL